LRHDKQIEIFTRINSEKPLVKCSFHAPAHDTGSVLLYPGKQCHKNVVAKFLGWPLNVKLT
jgi:hypothetical protein